MLLLTHHPSRAVCHLLIIPKRSLYSFCCDVRREGGLSTWRWPRIAARGVIQPVGPVISLLSYPVDAVYWFGGLETTLLSSRADGCSSADVCISCVENTALVSQSWNTSQLFPRWEAGQSWQTDFVRMVPESWGLFHIQFIYTVLVRAWHPRVITNSAPFYSQRLPIGTSQLMVTCW